MSLLTDILKGISLAAVPVAALGGGPIASGIGTLAGIGGTIGDMSEQKDLVAEAEKKRRLAAMMQSTQIPQQNPYLQVDYSSYGQPFSNSRLAQYLYNT